ncbi:LysR family transcriptional regulator [Cupriavidus oxalaticus]|uniref:LysR family transcriptional regulator n=1 Tax=Cupriavidus oxalaticus TaxID=96344 RepID=UPI00317546DB
MSALVCRAVRGRIQALETETGMQLCDRGTRGVTLTAVGKMVVERAKRIMFETRCLTRDLTLMREHVIGNVQFGLGPFPAATLLADTLRKLHAEWPQLQVAAEVNSPPVLLAALQAESLDFVVVERRTVPQNEDLSVHRLRPEAAGFFVRPSNPLRHSSRITPAQLREATLISVPFPIRGAGPLRKLLGCRSDERLPLQLESNDFHALTLLACQSDAVLLGPVRALTAAVEAGALARLEIAGSADDIAMDFDIVHLAHRTLSPAAQRTIATINALA